MHKYRSRDLADDPAFIYPPPPPYPVPSAIFSSRPGGSWNAEDYRVCGALVFTLHASWPSCNSSCRWRQPVNQAYIAVTLSVCCLSFFVTHGRDSPKVGWVTNRGQLGWKLGVQQVSQYETVDCVYYTGATNSQDVIALVHPSCACPPRVAVYWCVLWMWLFVITRSTGN